MESNNSKHTQGKWYAKGLHIMIEGKTGSQGQAFHQQIPSYENKFAKDLEGEANARLIAAAPDLLAFAQEMIKRYPNSPWISEQAQAAIDKATVQQ